MEQLAILNIRSAVHDCYGGNVIHVCQQKKKERFFCSKQSTRKNRGVKCLFFLLSLSLFLDDNVSVSVKLEVMFQFTCCLFGMYLEVSSIGRATFPYNTLLLTFKHFLSEESFSLGAVRSGHE